MTLKINMACTLDLPTLKSNKLFNIQKLLTIPNN